MITFEQYEQLRKIDTSSIYAEIREVVGKRNLYRVDATTILGAYGLYRAQEHPEKDYLDFDLFMMDFLSLEDEFEGLGITYNSHSMIADIYEDDWKGPWEEILELKGKYSQDELAACVLFGDKADMLNDISFGLSELILKSLDLHDTNTVFDFSVGGGSFLVESKLQHPTISFGGHTDGEHHEVVAYIRLKLLGIELDYVYDYVMRIKDSGEKYDKIFSQLFFNEDYLLRNLEMHLSDDIVEDIPKTSSLEWRLASGMLSYLNPDGKLCMVMKVNSISNRNDIAARKYYIDNGLVEQVILLPGRLYSVGQTVLVVFSQGNKSVKFIDASKLSEKGRVKGKVIDLMADNCADLLYGGTAISENYVKEASYESIKEDSYILDPKRHFHVQEDNRKFVAERQSLKRLDASVFRAAQFTTLDYLSDVETSIKCLSSRNIQDGVICGPFDYLVESLESKHQKFELMEGDLLITKNGNPFKIAVFDGYSGEKIIANGNLYIIRVNKYEANPYFLKAFFESEQGRNMLEKYSQGNTVKMITKKDLMDIEFPFPEFEERQKIAFRCEEISKSISDMKRDIQNMNDELANDIFTY